MVSVTFDGWSISGRLSSFFPLHPNSTIFLLMYKRKTYAAPFLKKNPGAPV